MKTTNSLDYGVTFRLNLSPSVLTIVHLFISAPTDQCPTLNLVIKTHGNVTSVNKQPVRCEVVGSLISTLREYRALTNLKSSPMLRPLLFPQISCFQPSQDTIPNLNLPVRNHIFKKNMTFTDLFS